MCVGISRSACEQVVGKYEAYLSQQSVLDGIFDEFDTNKSGVLEPDQLVNLLKKVRLNPTPITTHAPLLTCSHGVTRAPNSVQAAGFTHRCRRITR